MTAHDGASPVGRVRPILTDGAPVLRQAARPVEQVDAACRQAVADMAATLADFRARVGFGRAIAAPQIGVEAVQPAESVVHAFLPGGRDGAWSSFEGGRTRGWGGGAPRDLLQ